MKRNFDANTTWLIRSSNLAAAIQELKKGAELTAQNIDKLKIKNGLFSQSDIYKWRYKDSYFSTEVYNNDDGETDPNEPTSNGIAVINLTGVLLKDSYFDWYRFKYNEGMQSVGDKLQKLGQDNSILGVMIRVDSIGGSASGTETLANIIYNFKNTYKKPIWAHIDGTAYSAAYKVISGADRIILSGESSQVGSIGTMLQFYDDTDYYKKEGLKNVELYATLSENKNKEWRDYQDGKTQAIINELDKMNIIFLNQVIKGRGEKMGIKGKEAKDFTLENVPEQLTGATYMGQEAINAGLADEIASEQDALAKMFKKLDKSNEEKPVEQNSTIPIIF